ncbi:MAG: hypothetical protein ABEH88_04805 [Halobacteriales archaeon]
MDKDTLLELAPHYVAMFALVLIVLAVFRTVVSDFGLVVEFAIIFVVVFSYRPVVLRLGVAPSVWKQ